MAEDRDFWSSQSQQRQHVAHQPSAVTNPTCSTNTKAIVITLEKLKEGNIYSASNIGIDKTKSHALQFGITTSSLIRFTEQDGD